MYASDPEACIPAAPEVMFYNKRFYDGKKADVWSSGVMLYVMLFCTYPFGLPEDPHSRPDALAEFRERVEHGQLRCSPGCANSTPWASA